MPAWSFFKLTFLNQQSPACFWRHPIQAARVVSGALTNIGLSWLERWPGPARHACLVCGWQGRHFRTFLSADEIITRCICPQCGSFDRHRLLVWGVRVELARPSLARPQLLLGFSLSPALRSLLEGEGLPRCLRSDVEIAQGRFAPELLTDLRCCGIASETIDWIFCSHVLEHVDDLDACLAEMVRILRPEGIAWIQVPLEPGLEHSHRIPIDPRRAHAHAWQFGKDLGQLLTRPEWTVEEVSALDRMDVGRLRFYGIDPEERYWLARKV